MYIYIYIHTYRYCIYIYICLYDRIPPNSQSWLGMCALDSTFCKGGVVETGCSDLYAVVY